MTSPDTLKLTIRTMLAEDILDVVEIDQRSFSTPWSLETFHFEVERNQASRSWVAEVETEQGNQVIVGMIIVWLMVNEIHISTIAVDKPYRRKRIACRLLQTALQDAARYRIKSATLEVRQSNQAAINLYQHFGFATHAVRKRYYLNNDEDALVLRLNEIIVAQVAAISC